MGILNLIQQFECYIIKIMKNKNNSFIFNEILFINIKFKIL